MTLFFLPHAGGSAKSYVPLKRFLPKELSVVAMELSGRFTRSSEPLLDNIPDCAADLIEKHRAVLEEGDYALFGHSMGTVLATELVKQAKEKGLPQPRFVFLSGKNPPDEGNGLFEKIEKASDEEIVEFFNKNSFADAPVVPDEELIKILNRILCVDVRMAERYKATPEDVKFPCDIAVIYGEDDPLMQDADMKSWSRFTDGSCEVFPMSGGHFYYKEHKEEVCEIIKTKLAIK